MTSSEELNDPGDTNQDYAAKRWTRPQKAILKAAKNRFALEGLTGQKLWKKVAQEVKAVRPDVTPLTCRVKYKHILDKETKDDEAEAIQGLMQMMEPHLLATPPAAAQHAAQNFSEKTKDVNSIEKPSKRQKLSSTKWVWANQEPPEGKIWTKEETARLVELVKNIKNKKGMWKVVSSQMGNKTQQQCMSRWDYIKNNYMILQKKRSIGFFRI
ncbi:MAG: hypothetical protein BGO14_02735 [Chlamydiales bacterium 38-26]|nr:Myb-like DNA-binding domain-containing protein [Chlamydiales bacterium]OJV09267.1 MAG: hypothetical protein BGO14_02735 [Chlamydiales bacterium 38-26]